MQGRPKLPRLVPALLAWALLPACRQEMYDQPRKEPYEESAFFADGRASRPLVAGTVERGALLGGAVLRTGREGEEWASAFPLPVDEALLRRGRERYGIFCTPCHDAQGMGDGMIVRRGFPRPASFHVPRLREAAPGYFFDVITHGRGEMYPYAERIPVEDRWAIAAWIRVLQRSRTGTLDDVPEAQRDALQEAR